jgi:hypothetical protein
MKPVFRQRQADVRGLFRPVVAAFAFVSFLVLATSAPWAGAQSDGLIPATGSYRASGRADPPSYTVRAQVKRKAGRKVISAQVVDDCGGFATFAPSAIAHGSSGAPEFSARVGDATIRGRWIASTRIKGTVDTPCAKAQGYVMHLTG